MEVLQKQFSTSYEVTDTYAKCCIKITGKPASLADGEGMQVPCMLELEGQGRYIDVSKQNL